MYCFQVYGVSDVGSSSENDEFFVLSLNVSMRDLYFFPFYI